MNAMGSKPLTTTLFISLILITSFPSLSQPQQPYEGLAITDCENQHNSTSLLGYFCNGFSNSCQSFLTFHSQPPYHTVSSISTLLSSDPSQLSQLNSVSIDSTFPTSTKVIVPTTCSCSGMYYQANSSYVVKNQDIDITIANNTFQGLSSCQALHQQNNISSPSGFLFAGMKLTVPLRCACPTTRQRSNGVKYLLSYLVDAEDTVFTTGQRFGVDYTTILDANGISVTNANIYPFTTLLIPLKTKPNSSQVTKPSSSPPTSLAPPPLSSSPPGKKSNHTAIYVGIGVAVLFCVLILPSIVLYYIRLKHKKGEENESEFALVDNPNISGKQAPESWSSGMLTDFGQSLKVYKFGELQVATENFGSKCRVEGTVYRGVVNGDFAAVKILNRDVSNEIEILKKINHFNLIRLSGLCFNQGRWYLVYEYAQNGSLSNWIFDRSGTMILSWIRRVQIALDVANGLNYLHRYTEQPHVHKDIKSSNILLDSNFRGKIANFGLARPAEGKECEFELTTHIVGTQGYMAPEYLEHGLISPKLDVYAFGIVMLEIITGRDVVSIQNGEGGFALKEFIAMVTEEAEGAREKIESFIDPLMEGNYPLDSAIFMARLIEGCLRKEAANRPNMGDILLSLSKLNASSDSVSACQSSNCPVI